MSGQASGSGSGSNPGTPKAIASLAKRPSDVTRQGTQKLKFVPTLPARRKKEEVKSEPESASAPPTTARGRGRGRGRGDGSPRGVARPPFEMTASGPFAMGPALAGSSGRRSVPRSSFASAPVGSSSGTKSSLGAGLSAAPPPSIGSQHGDVKGKVKKEEVDEEEYSDPDEGVEIVDLEQVKQLDWMAPEVLKRERSKRIKKEDDEKAAAGEVDLANAIDLSDSEEEEVLEDIKEDFELKAELDMDPTLRQDRIYFFRFPHPFPTFVQPPEPSTTEQASTASSPSKKVTFAPDVKPDPGPISSPSTPVKSSVTKPVPINVDAIPESKPQRLDGIIGQLEVYRSGAVKMRLKNGILLDVNASTQPSFLQQAVQLDMEDKRLVVLGEVNKQFVVSPDVDSLLNAMEESERQPKVKTLIEGEEKLISMDTS